MLRYNPDASNGKRFGIGIPLPDVITFKDKNKEDRQEPREHRRYLSK
jgi:hypothetical protein